MALAVNKSVVLVGHHAFPLPVGILTEDGFAGALFGLVTGLNISTMVPDESTLVEVIFVVGPPPAPFLGHTIGESVQLLSNLNGAVIDPTVWRVVQFATVAADNVLVIVPLAQEQDGTPSQFYVIPVAQTRIVQV